MMFGFNFEGIAQQPLPFILTEKDYPIDEGFSQFPSFDIECDTSGYIYLSYFGKGCKFNGKEIFHFKTKKDVQSVGITQYYKDARQRIWANTTKFGMGYVKGDSLLPYKYRDSLRWLFRKQLESLYLDSNDVLHLGYRTHGYFTVSDSGEVTEVLGRTSGLEGFVLTQLEDGTAHQFSIFQKGAKDRLKYVPVYYLHPSGELDSVTSVPYHKVMYETSLLFHKDGTWTFSNGSYDLIRGLGDSLIFHREFPHAVTKLFEDSHHNIWLGTTKNGIHRALDDELRNTQVLLATEGGAAVTEYPKGSIWIKSTDGLFRYIPDLNLVQYPRKNKADNSIPVLSIVRNKDTLYAFMPPYRILGIVGDSTFNLQAPIARIEKSQPRGLAVATCQFLDTINNHLWMGHRYQLSRWNGKKWQIIRMNADDYKNPKTIAIDQLPGGAIFGITSSELFFIEDEEITQVFSAPAKLKGINAIASDTFGTIWIASNTGIWQWKNEKFLRPEQRIANDTDLQGPINFIRSFHGVIAMQPMDRPLTLITRDSIFKMLDSLGMPLRCQELVQDDQGSLFGRESTKRPMIYRIDFENGVPRIKEFLFNEFAKKASIFDGSLAVVKGQVYYGTAKGLFRTPVKQLNKQRQPPKVKIKKVLIRQQPVPLQGRYDLEPSQNAIYIFFHGISYRFPRPKFRYRLKGLESDWTTPEYTGIQFTNLDPGDYVFQVQAKIRYHDWGPMEEIHFHIQTPYWQTWWFRTLIVLAGSLLIGGLVSLYYQGQRRRNLLEIEKLTAEHRALRAQMNPHFVFNALSSIQDLVFSEDRVFAVTNIAMFAKLMRKILAHSAQESITLKEEVEVLTLYLKLEALRFEGQFQFFIKVADGIDPHTQMIPPVFIQPFAENAIKHGLLNKKPSGGVLKIQFERDQEILVCTVEDDGVGREASSQIQAHRNPSHRSFGTHSVNERIRLLNSQRQNKIKLNIHDLKDEQQQAVGTRIEIRIP